MATNFINIGLRIAPDIGVIQSDISVAYTIIRPIADVTDGGWLNESGNNTNLYASVDDDPTNDATYIISPLSTTPNMVELRLADPLGTPPAGGMTLTLRIRRV